MSVIVEKEMSYFVSTSAGNLDSNTIVSADGSRITVTLDSPIYFNPSSVHNTVEVQQSSIWNTSYNISATLGNNKFDYLIATVAQPQITIPDGLYSVSTLNAEIVRQIINAGNPSTTVTMSGNNSTQKVVLTFDATVEVDFTVANTVGTSVLGFAALTYPTVGPAPFSGYTEEAPNIAAFNNTNNFNLTSNIPSEGIKINNFGKGLMASIPITAGVGSIVNYSPVNPSKVSLDNRRGRNISTFYVQVSDDNGDPLPQTETWSALLVFRSSILLSNEKVPFMDL